MIDSIRLALLVVFVALLVGGGSYAFSKSQAEVYESRAQLGYGRLLSPELQALGANSGEPDVDDDVRLATEAQRVDSFDVAVATARAVPQLGLSPGQIASRVSAEPRRGTLVVALTAVSSTARGAARLANAYADRYLALLRKRERTRSRSIERVLRQRLASLSEDDSAGPLGAGLRNQIGVVNVLRRVGSGSPQIIERARASDEAAEPQTQRNTLFGLLFGLAAGVGLVALRAEGPGRAAVSTARATIAHRREPPARER